MSTRSIRGLHLFGVVLILLAVAVPGVAEHVHGHGGNGVGHLLRAVNEDLSVLEELNARNRNPHLRQRTEQRLVHLRQHLQELESILRHASPSGPQHGHRADVGPMPMEPDDFERFLAELRKLPFPAGRIALVRDVARVGFFTTVQVVAVVDAMAHGSDKVEVAAILHARVIDPQNFYLVYSHIPFESGRQQLRARIGDPQ